MEGGRYYGCEVFQRMVRMFALGGYNPTTKTKSARKTYAGMGWQPFIQTKRYVGQRWNTTPKENATAKCGALYSSP